MDSTVEWIAAGIFALAIVHTFSTKYFERLAHERPRHAGIWHLLGEVEVVFGFWAAVLVLVMAALLGPNAATGYVDARELHRAAVRLRHHGDRRQPRHPASGAADRDRHRCAVAGCGAGRALFRHLVAGAAAGFADHRAGGDDAGSPDAARPGLPPSRFRPAQVRHPGRAVREHLDRRHLDAVRGAAGADGGRYLGLGPAAHGAELRLEGRAGCGLQCVGGSPSLFRRELAGLPTARTQRQQAGMPAAVVAIHVLFLAGVVVFAHHPPVFLGLLLFFLGLGERLSAVPGPPDAARRPAGRLLPGRAGGAGRPAAMVAAIPCCAA